VGSAVTVLDTMQRRGRSNVFCEFKYDEFTWSEKAGDDAFLKLSCLHCDHKKVVVISAEVVDEYRFPLGRSRLINKVSGFLIVRYRDTWCSE
jgi:hypothetical protein